MTDNNSVVYIIIMGIPNHLSEDSDMTISECILVVIYNIIIIGNAMLIS